MANDETPMEQRAWKAITEFRRKAHAMGLSKYPAVVQQLKKATTAAEKKDYNLTLILVEDPGVFLERCKTAKSKGKRK